jgi:hypothetical protein
MRRIVAAVGAMGVGASLLVAAPGPAPAGAGEPAPVEGLPGDLTLNQIQVIGSHNSYHQEPRPYLLDTLIGLSSDAEQLEYSHAPLDDQFETMGVRQIELDVFADAGGGLYDDPRLGPAPGEPADPDPYDPSTPAMAAPGFKVLHIQDVDYETTCQTLVACLDTVDGWSDANPGHLPLAILIEAKDDPVPPEYPDLGWVDPEPIDADALDALDAEIRSVFTEDELFTPDDLQGSAETLNEAVLAGDWPTLDEAQGQVLFLLDNEGSMASTYSEGHTSLDGRVMFTSSPVGTDTSAFVKRNDPEGANTAEIQDLVTDGYVVRTRSDDPTFEARSGDRTQQEAALTAGAQWVSTDYPVPGISARFGSTYFTALPGFFPGRCNPVNAEGLCGEVVGCRSPFLDVGDSHVFRDEICALAESRLTGGFTDRTFRPSRPVTRAAMAAFLFRRSGEDVPVDCIQEFSDVPETHAFFEEICWLAASGITTGFPGGTFRPSAVVTRQAMAAFLQRAADGVIPEDCVQEFSDVPVSSQFFDEICWLVDQGITTGFPGGTFRPSAAVARQAMAAFLVRLDEA